MSQAEDFNSSFKPWLRCRQINQGVYFKKTPALKSGGRPEQVGRSGIDSFHTL